jgi:hypothetical protein
MIFGTLNHKDENGILNHTRSLSNFTVEHLDPPVLMKEFFLYLYLKLITIRVRRSQFFAEMLVNSIMGSLPCLFLTGLTRSRHQLKY